MELDESSRILYSCRSLPDTPESTKSDLAQLIRNEEQKEEEDEEKEEERRTLTTLSFVNSIIGPVVIAMPFAFKEAGFGLGILMVLILTLVSDYSTAILIRGAELSNTNTYQAIVRAAFGRTGYFLLTALQFAMPFIVMVSYNVIIADTVTTLALRIIGHDFRLTFIGRREFIVTVFTLLVTLPLSLYRNITRFVKVSLVAIVFIIFIMGVMISRVFTMIVPSTTDAWRFADTGFIRAVGILVYAFVCHHNSFVNYESTVEVGGGGERRWDLVQHASLLFSMICTLIVGITGYATFTGFTQGDVLENFCIEDDLVNFSRLLFVATTIFLFPFECSVARQLIEKAVFACREPPSPLLHILTTVVIVTLSALVSMATDCVAIVLGLNGVLSAAPVAYVMPAACALKLQNERLMSARNLPLVAVIVFGVCLCAVGMVAVVMEITEGLHCNVGNELLYCDRSLATNATQGFHPRNDEFRATNNG